MLTRPAITCNTFCMIRFKVTHLSFATSVSLSVRISSHESCLSAAVIFVGLDIFHFCLQLNNNNNNGFCVWKHKCVSVHVKGVIFVWKIIGSNNA
jgi:hypothetical protein